MLRRRSRRVARNSRRSVAAMSSLVVVTAALALIVGAVAGRWFFGTTSAPAAQTVQFAIDLPTGESIQDHSSSSIAFSRDGTRLAYAVNRADGRGLYLRSLQDLTPQWLAAGERVASPFFSSDGGWIAFESGGILKRIAVDGGSAIPITDVPYFAGGTWGPDNTIVFVPSFTAGLWKISANGGRRARLTTSRPARGRTRAHLARSVAQRQHPVHDLARRQRRRESPRRVLPRHREKESRSA